MKLICQIFNFCSIFAPSQNIVQRKPKGNFMSPFLKEAPNFFKKFVKKIDQKITNLEEVFSLWRCDFYLKINRTAHVQSSEINLYRRQDSSS